MPTKGKSGANERTTVDFHYVKSNYFRVVHADGIFGGATPNGDLLMTVWNQRVPIPKKTTHVIGDDGSIGQEIDRESRVGIVREVEVGVVFKPDAVKSIIEWLLTHSGLLAVREESNGTEPKS